MTVSALPRCIGSNENKVFYELVKLANTPPSGTNLVLIIKFWPVRSSGEMLRSK